jgi:peptide/nickel transport system substrate-binding protein
MNFQEKLKDYFLHFKETFNDIRGITFDDASGIYKSVLKRVPDISHLKNVVLFSGIGTLFIFILFAQRFSALSDYLPKNPALGGTYSEGMIGKIEQLNPLFSPTNPAEQAAVSLIFSGLTKKDNNRTNTPDLAEKWAVSPDGKTYTFTIKKNLKWQDGRPLTVDDVLFTISSIQNPDTRSPLLDVWRGVEVSKSDQGEVLFKLSSPYNAFVTITDVPIIPKHLLENVPAKNLRTAEFGTKPIGSGPFSFESLKVIKDTTEVNLVASKYYYMNKPYIEKVSIKTYPDNSSLTRAYTRREVLGINHLSISELGKKSELPNIETYNLAIPSYDAMYFNLRAGVGTDKSFREAVSLLIDRAKIMENIYQDQALPIYSPIIPGYPGYDAKIKQTFNIEGARAKLLGAGYALGPDGVFKKGEQRASARLVVQDEYLKVQTAETIKKNCAQAGIEILIEKYPAGTFFQDYVRPRNFDIVLISQNLGADSDIYAFWHSTQVTDPGLNLSGYSDRALDKFMEQARTSTDAKVKNEKYSDVAQIIAAETPAVYIVWPNYVFGLSKTVMGFEPGRFVEPKDHFSNITDWYIKSTIAQ